MAQALFPDPKFRSPTALSDKGDVRDENVYSAVRFQHGGTNNQKIFTVPFGQSIVALAGSSGINDPPTGTGTGHQGKYTELTTNLTKAGEIGPAIGDVSIRAIGTCIEQCGITEATGLPRAYGASQFEIAEILARTYLELKIGGKRQIIGPTNTFPSYGGMAGSVSTAGNAATASIVTNGWPGSMRRLRYALPCARNDALEVTVGVAGSSSLSFRTTSGDGQPCLMWVLLGVASLGDVR